MRDIRKQAETLQLSIYSNIICQTLKNHENLSLGKLLTFTYLIKQNKFLGGPIYDARNKKEVIYKGLSLISGDFEGYSNSIPYIIKALHLLIDNEIVFLENGNLYLNNKELELDEIYLENNFMKKVIDESRFMSDKQFMREVLYNV